QGLELLRARCLAFNRKPNKVRFRFFDIKAEQTHSFAPPELCAKSILTLLILKRAHINSWVLVLRKTGLRKVSSTANSSPTNYCDSVCLVTSGVIGDRARMSPTFWIVTKGVLVS